MSRQIFRPYRHVIIQGAWCAVRHRVRFKGFRRPGRASRGRQGRQVAPKGRLLLCRLALTAGFSLSNRERAVEFVVRGSYDVKVRGEKSWRISQFWIGLNRWYHLPESWEALAETSRREVLIIFPSLSLISAIDCPPPIRGAIVPPISCPALTCGDQISRQGADWVTSRNPAWWRSQRVLNATPDFTLNESMTWASRRELDGAVLDLSRIPQCSASELSAPGCPLLELGLISGSLTPEHHIDFHAVSGVLVLVKFLACEVRLGWPCKFPADAHALTRHNRPAER
jgi:hypothetical protein